jgi:hypothetical protein
LSATLYQKALVHTKAIGPTIRQQIIYFQAEITGNRAYAVKSDDGPKLIKPISGVAQKLHIVKRPGKPISGFML